MITRFLAAAVSVMLGAAAAGACMQQELMELAQKNPQKLQSVTPKYQEAGQKLQDAMQKGGGLDAVCKYYDELLADVKG